MRDYGCPGTGITVGNMAFSDLALVSQMPAAIGAMAEQNEVEYDAMWQRIMIEIFMRINGIKGAE